MEGGHSKIVTARFCAVINSESEIVDTNSLSGLLCRVYNQWELQIFKLILFFCKIQWSTQSVLTEENKLSMYIKQFQSLNITFSDSNISVVFGAVGFLCRKH